MHRHANEAELGLSSLANVTSLNDVLLTSPGDVFFQVMFYSFLSKSTSSKKLPIILPCCRCIISNDV